ncbi:hypothetical protein P301_O30076 [Saccharomyces cerevisiae P301]|nr:hypothetical protein P301_O30076 [Saccharomyces cerevisiae P301]CAY86675.1 Fre7p [Saccharomyces cerevisiae EC1118]GES71223.1 hypothetical protein SCEPF1_0075001300 [Saccharomyces cerevisiae]GMC35595.1 unnamed protein product [Saccharomyces cerevisiae]GMC39628.1 unnamed protein product [Saccharomyces cerevisiae]
MSDGIHSHCNIMMKKRDLVLKNGLRCIADMESVLYIKLEEESQLAVPWAYQAEYGKFTVYLIVAIIFVCFVKKILLKYLDSSENFVLEKRNHQETPSWFLKKTTEKLLALNRYFSYRRLPTAFFSALGIPTSVGTILIILAVIIYTLVYCFVPHPYYRACAGFGSPPLAVRSGIIAIALVPFVFALSGKVNIIGWLVGLSYEKLSIFHQWTSVICLFFSWVHTVCFLYQAFREGGTDGMQYQWKSQLIWRTGVPPLLFLTLLWLFSLLFIRKYIYELFLQFHWILAIGFYVSLFYHVYPELNTHMYLVGTIVIWFAQLLYRLVSKGYLRPGKTFMTSSIATITLKGIGCIELIVKDIDMDYSPGQHILLRTIDKDVVENHPFSIFPSSHSPGALKILMRAQNGFTKSLYLSQCTAKRILVDGPYGGIERDVRSFTNLYLICSGSGISSCLPFLIRYGPLLQETNLRFIRLEWIIRYEEDISWVSDELRYLTTILKRSFLEGRIVIKIYICSSSHCSDLMNPGPQLNGHSFEKGGDGFIVNEGSSRKRTDSPITFENFDKNGSATKFSDCIDLKYYKPSLDQLMNQYDIGSKNCFVCSGSDSLKTTVSNTVAKLQLKVFSKEQIDECYLHTESFGY